MSIDDVKMDLSGLKPTKAKSKSTTAKKKAKKEPKKDIKVNIDGGSELGLKL